MLTTLRRIVQEVDAARDLNEALQIAVVRIKETINTHACSLFLLDNQSNEYVLMATEGLNADAVGKIRFGFTEGLVGYVGQREEPINLDNAPEHPHFYRNFEAGEEQYHAFLGVPVIHKRQLLGVMTIQQEEQRCFDESEEAFLVTLCAQLAGVIAHAEALGMLAGLTTEAEPLDLSDVAALGGIPCVSGVGIGTAVVIYPKADLDAVPERPVTNIVEEIEHFRLALQATRDDMRRLGERLAEALPPEEHAVFEVYLKILDNDELIQAIEAEIESGVWAQTALRRVIERYVQQFAAMEDVYLQERASDIKDLGRRVLAYLQEAQRSEYTYPEQTVLMGDEITASDLAEVPEGILVGIVSAKGSTNSHVAILARALGIPTVMGAAGKPLNHADAKEVVVDGYYGHVYVAPSQQLRDEFVALAEEERELDAGLAPLRDVPAQTLDGHEVTLHVNTGLIADAGLALSVGAAGVGLFRTEVAFMARECFPTEEEQRVLYQQLLSAFSPRPVVLRTLDVGGDKSLPYFPIEEENPFLGWRGIRLTLDHPEVFLVQVRGMLRASEGINNLKIMLPMIASVGELDEALHLIHRAYSELLEDGLAIEMPEIGVMIEVPSAIYLARDLAKRVDFLSVGSNDLTQYLLAVDRNNSRVADLYDALHPAVLRALQQVVIAAHQENKPVSICGEMASDPVAVILLLALGFDALSMNAGSLLRVKWVIRKFSLTHAQQLLDEVFEMDNPTMIRFRLERAIDEAGLGGLIRAGKQ